MASAEVAGLDSRLTLYDRRHDEVFELWLSRLDDPDAAEDAAQWVLLGSSEGESPQGALDDLPVAARNALLLRERDGLSYADVAKRLSVTEPTAKRIVYVARLRLAEALGRVRQALSIAPLLSWTKSTAAGVTAAKGVAAVATIGAAAGLATLPAAAPTPGPALGERASTLVGTSIPDVVDRGQSIPRPEPSVGDPARVERAPVVAASPPSASPSTSAPATVDELATVPITPAMVDALDPAAPLESDLPSVPEAPTLTETPTVPEIAVPKVEAPALPEVPTIPEAALPEVELPALPETPSVPEVAVPIPVEPILP